MKETIYNNGGDELRIKTTWGDLVVQVGYDAEYPEVYVSLQMPDKVEFILACIGQADDNIKIRTKDYIGSMDFTEINNFSGEEIDETWSDVVNGSIEFEC